MNRIWILILVGLVGVSLTAGANTEVGDSVDSNRKVHVMDDVVVTDLHIQQRQDVVQIGQEKIRIADLQRMPAFMGEVDLFRSLQLLPGIKQENEASTGFEVRGGRTSQNLVTLDCAPVYQAGHLMGMFSVFNNDAISGATLSKGLIPAQYGDATSSVLDVSAKSGDMTRHNLGGTVGLLAVKAFANGPIVRDKLSYLVSFRRSYADMFLKMIPKYSGSILYFYDINAKLDWQVGQRDRLSLTFYNGRDVFGMDDFANMRWTNLTTTLRWNHYYNRRLSSSTNLYLTHFDCNMEMTGLGMNYDQSGFNRHYGLNHDFRWSPIDALTLHMGLQTALINQRSGKWTIGNVTQQEQRKAWENAVWTNLEWKAADPVLLSAGVRLNTFSALGGSDYYDIDANGNITKTYNPDGIVKTHVTVEPRFSANIRVAEGHNIKTGYTMSSQNIHAIRSSMSMPFDRYTMSSNIIRPEIAHQWSIGYFTNFARNAYDLSIEGYYKDVRNVYDYRDGKSFRSEIEMERLLLGGKSRAYGVEISARKNLGKLTGQFSYTLSWVKYQIDGINNNQWYTANNDRRHDISILLMYRFNDRWDMSATWLYTSGQALTAPSAKYELDGDYYYYYAQRNGYRAPAYHRLDVGVNYTRQYKHHTGILNFGFYNLYNRRNPFAINFINDNDVATGVRARKISLYGMIPTISYSVKY